MTIQQDITFENLSYLDGRESMPSDEIYRAFQVQYGPGFVDIDGQSSQRMIANAVLHFDDAADEVVHLAVHDMGGRLLPGIPRRQGPPYRLYPHSADQFVVASTDGEHVVRWPIQSVTGYYGQPINPVDKQYQRQFEELVFTFALPYTARLTLNYEHGTGTFVVGDRMGWILNPEQSLVIRGQHEAVPDLGHIAVAS